MTQLSVVPPVPDTTPGQPTKADLAAQLQQMTGVCRSMIDVADILLDILSAELEPPPRPDLRVISGGK
jgi:hypothetical protein